MQTQLPPEIRRVWQLRALIDGALWVIVAIGLGIATALWHWPWWLILIVCALGVLTTGVELALVPYRYAFWRYQITDTAVYLRSGYIFQKDSAIPISRVQNVTLAAGPLLQRHHLQAVQIQTAATQHEIAGVTPAVADELREKIMRLAQEAQDEA